MARVSVIIPAYNGAAYISQAIESVLRHGSADLEVIVVDDGSTDETSRVLEGFRGDVIVLYQENRGMASARNRGIRASSGEYIAFVDQDDYWLDGKLTAQLACFQGRPQVGLVYADAFLLQDTHYLPQTFFTLCPPHRGQVFDRLLLDSFIPIPTVVVRRECLENVGLFDERLRICADYDLWLRVAAGYEVDYVEVPLAVYRRHEGNTSKNAELALTEAIRVTETCLSNPLMPTANPKLVRSRLSMLRWQLGVAYLQNGDRKRAREEFVRAARLNLRFVRPYIGYFLSLTFGKEGLSILRKVWYRVRQSSGVSIH